jgi:hypothetical protein
MPSLCAFPSWAEAYRNWCVLNAIGWRLSPIMSNNNGIFTFTAEAPRGPPRPQPPPPHSGSPPGR